MIRQPWCMPMLFAGLFAAPALAANHDAKVEALSREVKELRAFVEAIKPTVTSVMPDFAERFHVMHYAGDAGDWAIAAHEIEAMEGLTGLVKRVDPEKGKLMEAFMDPALRELKEAAEKSNPQRFRAAVEQAVKNCNGCHVATGNARQKVVLGGRESLSLRHPHAFARSKAEPEPEMGGTMKGMKK